MKKLVALLFVLSLLLCSCGGEEAVDYERFFDYQSSIRMAEGTFFDGAREYGIRLYFRSGKEGFCRRIEYTSPEEIEGLIFTLEGEKITAELCGVRINASSFQYESVFRMRDMFSLSEKDIQTIEAGEGETTVATGKSGNACWQVTTDKRGAPLEIYYSSSEKSFKMTVDKIEFAEQPR